MTLREVLIKAKGTDGLLTPSEVLKLVDALEEAVLHLWSIGSSRGEILDILDNP